MMLRWMRKGPHSVHACRWVAAAPVGAPPHLMPPDLLPQPRRRSQVKGPDDASNFDAAGGSAAGARNSRYISTGVFKDF